MRRQALCCRLCALLHLICTKATLSRRIKKRLMSFLVVPGSNYPGPNLNTSRRKILTKKNLPSYLKKQSKPISESLQQMRYVGKEKASRIDERFGLRLPDILHNPAFMPNAQIHGMGRGNMKALRRTKILTEKNLPGYLHYDLLKYMCITNAHTVLGSSGSNAALPTRQPSRTDSSEAQSFRSRLNGMLTQSRGRREILNKKGLQGYLKTI